MVIDLNKEKNTLPATSVNVGLGARKILNKLSTAQATDYQTFYQNAVNSFSSLLKNFMNDAHSAVFFQKEVCFRRIFFFFARIVIFSPVLSFELLSM